MILKLGLQKRDNSVEPVAYSPQRMRQKIVEWVGEVLRQHPELAP